MTEQSSLTATWNEGANVVDQGGGNTAKLHPNEIDRFLARASLRTDYAGFSIRRMKEDATEWEVVIELLAPTLSASSIDTLEAEVAARPEVTRVVRSAVEAVAIAIT